jgi:hypothetical protein
MENEFVQVTKFVEADITLVEMKRNYKGDPEYYKVSFLFKEGLYTIIQSDQDGNVEKYRSRNYGACKLDEDIILFMDTSHGWLPHEQATKEWANRIAERELLDVTTSNRKK